MPHRVLVTGAHGFIGRNVARAWSRKGWRVDGLGHGKWQRDEWESWGIETWRNADVSLDSLRLLEAGPDLIVHCAGSGSVAFSVAQPLADFQRSVETTVSVLEFMRLHSPTARLVMLSSAAVYGEVESARVSEFLVSRPVSPYGVHKHVAEEMCRSYAAHFGLNVSIVRFFSVYGAGLRKQLLWDACEKLRKGQSSFGGSGLERRDWIHVSDATILIDVAAGHASPACEVVNGGSGTSTTVREMLAHVARRFPDAPALEFSGKSRPGDPSGLEADNARAHAWGWRAQTDLRSGVDAYVDWYLDGAR